MATSGVYSLALRFNQIATEALDLLQVVGDGEMLSGDMVSRAQSAFNLMIKEWESQGIHLWSYEEGTLFLEKGREKYDFRDSNTRLSNEWFETRTTVDTLVNDLSFDVEDTSNILDGDTIGIIQSDNNLFWTTVDGDPVGNTIFVTDNIPLTTLSGAFVRNYRDTFIPVSRISMQGVRRREGNDYEIPIIFESRQDYFDLPNKEQLGTPIQAYYSRSDIAGEIGGIMYLWSTPISSVPVINFTYERKLQIVQDPAIDTVDVPDYAQEAVVYNLAERLIPKFGGSVERVTYIRDRAREKLDNLLAYDNAAYPIVMKMERYG